MDQILSEPKKAQLNQMWLPASKYIGMNNLPVLDQGQWGTCVMFAATEAVDSLYDLTGDNTASQLCSLEVGRAITPQFPDAGWNGNIGYKVLDQLSKYGYVDTVYQKGVGCGGLKSYPVQSEDNGKPMPIDIFTSISHKQFSVNDWSPIYNFPGYFKPPTPTMANQILTNIKQAINGNSRVTFGIMFANRVGHLGALGSYNNVANDTWVLTDQIKESIFKPGNAFAHEMVIDGYNDNACVDYKDKDNKTQKQCGLLRARNSMGAKAGDNGDYYITYDYLKGLMIEAYVIGKNAKTKAANLQVQ